MARKKASTQPVPAEPAPTTTSSRLVICRNKHWRYISSFHGPWLQLPIEILESLAHQNWTMPSPRLIDPAVFFDVVKIRKYVDEAAYDAVRASTGISNTAMSGRMDYFGAGGGPSSQLSKERIFRIRQKAVGMLNEAFVLDEVAASVASMQATSSIEDLGLHVLRREPNSHVAKYVHFFHAKIPSRGMEDHTPLDPLNEVISTLSWEDQGSYLRTRALTQILKQQYEGAAVDLSSALRVAEELKRIHKPNQQQLELASKMRAQHDAWQKGSKDGRNIPPLKDEDQPKSLEMQLLFHRGTVYLTLACQSVNAALDGLKEYQTALERGEINGVETKEQNVRLDARKRVKTNAKRAIKDLLAFISHFEYTPGLPFEITNAIMSRVYDLASGNKAQTETSRLVGVTNIEEETAKTQHVALVRANTYDHNTRKKSEPGWTAFPPPKIYPASALFADKPPPDLPAYPESATPGDANIGADVIKQVLRSREAITYHPLLTEALHSLLLAHTLLQTSTTELQRHAYNVARLVRISDGYPIFQSARSPARADWTELLSETKGWLGLSASWQNLCAPAPLPDDAGGWTRKNSYCPSTKEVRKERPDVQTEQDRQRIKQESILDALSDERVVDEKTFQEAVRAREERAGRCDTVANGLENGRPAGSIADQSSESRSPAHGDNSGFRGYPITSDRAQSLARWINEAPASMGGRKKRPARRKKPADSNVPSLAESVSTLSIDVEDDVD